MRSTSLSTLTGGTLKGALSLSRQKAKLQAMPDAPAPFTVSEITRQIKDRLEVAFPYVVVEGELSNVRPSSTGHLYFTLKDDSAALSGVMFRGRASSLTFTPEDGQLVNAAGSISVYAKRGTYQLIVESMRMAGVGRILATLEERKRRLSEEGLFDESRKRRLPLFPSTVAIVTSPTGAALRDILNVLGRRHAGIDLVICPTPVQGDEAAPRIAQMIRAASIHKLGDVIIVTRGGGSIEDLLPFSDEEVVRAVAQSEVPVISAVGHEIDWALVDFAADKRAPTPSAAAEIVASSRDELHQRVLELARATIATFASRVQRARIVARQFAPSELHRSYLSLAQPILLEFDQLREELVEAMRDRTREARHALQLAGRELEACSPYDVLKRGYSIVRNEAGKVLTNASRVGVDDLLSIKLQSGSLDAAVKEIHTDEEL
jgi:exodeoxyribonuclease VII large subunit